MQSLYNLSNLKNKRDNKCFYLKQHRESISSEKIYSQLTKLPIKKKEKQKYHLYI